MRVSPPVVRVVTAPAAPPVAVALEAPVPVTLPPVPVATPERPPGPVAVPEPVRPLRAALEMVAGQLAMRKISLTLLALPSLC